MGLIKISLVGEYNRRLIIFLWKISEFVTLMELRKKMYLRDKVGSADRMAQQIL